MKSKETSLVPLAVHGMTFPVLLDEKGEEHVRVADLCAPFGLDAKGQRVRVRGLGWARGVMISSHIESTAKKARKAVDVFCVPVRKVGMFFATLDPARIKPEYRASLERFQDEISDAVHEYLANGGAIRPGARPEQLDRLLENIRELLRDAPLNEPAWPARLVHRYASWHGQSWRIGQRHPSSMKAANDFIYRMIFEPHVYAVIRERGLSWACRYHQTLKDKPRSWVVDQLTIVANLANECSSESSWRTRMRRWYRKTKADLRGQSSLAL